MVVGRSQMTAYADLLGRPCAGWTLYNCPRYHMLQWDAPQKDPAQTCDQLMQPKHCPLPLSREQDAPVLEVLVGLLSWEPEKRTPAATAATARLFPLAQQAEIASTFEELARPLGLEPDKKSEPGMKLDANAADADAADADAAHDEGCRCCGQCGRFLCRRRRNQKSKHGHEFRICSGKQCPGSLYCCECKCELDTCSPLAVVVVNG